VSRFVPREGLRSKERQGHHRRSRPGLDHEEAHERERARHEERSEARPSGDARRVDQTEDDKAEPRRGQRGAEPIGAVRGVLVARLVDPEDRHAHDDDGDRHVEEEEPAP
jgi:hypothetical protein